MCICAGSIPGRVFQKRKKQKQKQKQRQRKRKSTLYLQTSNQSFRAMVSREDDLKKVLGEEKFDAIRKSKILLVGAGGIGCELLKDLILLGYGEIHVVDLDTIDLSNLNRQFLFRQKDIKKPKSLTAVEAVQSFNFFKTKLVPYQASIYEVDRFPLSWFKQFDLILNALDNIAARSYINKIALFLDKKVMESGTTGTNGQVQPTFPTKTECYECVHRETPKTFPVCTIRSTPSQPVHCVHWAKSFLFSSLFAEEDDVEADLGPEGKSAEELGTDNQEEIKNLISENNELLDLKRSIKDKDFPTKIIEKVFVRDIAKLLKLTDLWKSRTPPSPLDYDKYKDSVSKITQEDLGTGQKVWTIEQNLRALIDATESLQKRMATEKEIEFDKDDEDTLTFVVASTNIRSFIFGIPLKSKFDIKSVAGNIIPAIATTNAVIAGFSSLLSLRLFNASTDEQIASSRAVFTSPSSDRVVMPSLLARPNPKCAACSIPRAILNIDNNLTIGSLIDALIEKYSYDEEIAISVGSRLLYDIDFVDNKERKLIDLGVIYGDHLSITDETDVKRPVEFFVELNKKGEINLPDIEIPDLPKAAEEEKNEAKDENDDFELIIDNVDDNVDEVVLIENPSEEKRKAPKESNPITKKPKLDKDIKP